MIKLLTIAGAFVLPWVLSAQTPAPSARNDAKLEKELTRLARERILTFDKGDPKLWSPYVAAGYFIATPSGTLQSKEQVMRGFRPPLAGYSDDFHFEDVRVARDGDTAVMTYRIIETEDWDGQKVVTQPLRKTDTYILRGGRWLILGSQETFYPSKPASVTVSRETLERYTGIYRLMRSLSYRISVADGKLVLQEIGQADKTELLPESETTFFAPDDTARYIFVPSADERVERMLIRNSGYDLKAEKIE
jgi:hypothetical protein